MNEVMTALDYVKQGAIISILTETGNKILIEKVGEGKYEVKDELGTKEPIYLKYSGVKELLEKFYDNHNLKFLN